MTQKPITHLISLTIAILMFGYWLYYMFTTPSNVFIHWLPTTQQSYDPDMAYIYNSILPFTGVSYTHVYHPGTAMHIVGTVFAALFYPIARMQDVPLAQFHAENPFPLWYSVRLLLGIMGTLTTVMLFRLTRIDETRTALLFASATAVTYLAVYSFGFISLLSWGHASMGYSFGTLILLWLFRIIVTDTPLTRARYWSIGALSGVLTATAYYYAPWVVGSLITVFGVMLVRKRGFGRAFLGAFELGAASLVGFMLANAPIWHKFDQFLTAVRLIAGSKGIHGTGGAGFTTVSSLIGGARGLYSIHPLVFWATGTLFLVTLVMLVLHRKRLQDHASLWIMLIGFTAHILLAMLLVFKHPGGSYLNTFVPTLPIIAALLYRIMDTPTERRLAQGLATLTLVVFAWQYIHVVILQQESVRMVQARMADTDTTIATYAETYGQSSGNVLIVTTYGAHFGCYGMMFGNGYTDYQLQRYTGASCPNLVEFRGGSDGAQITKDSWLTLDDESFCWDIAFVESERITGLLATFTEQPALDSGYRVFYNDWLYAPRESVRIEFDNAPCGTGWHTPQKADGDIKYSWMSETISTLEMKLVEGQDYRLTVQVFASITPEILMSFTPYINGEALTMVPGENAGEFMVDIPAELVERNKNATLVEFHIGETVSPGAENGDPRQLGVALDWVEIVPLADPQP